ncbi:MAG TPA: hypothetical protein VF406_20750 [Thermodesulfobacteriota bacterium]
MPTRIGERYQCGTCGATFLVTRPGTGVLACCGRPMDLVTPAAARPPAAPAPDRGRADEEEEDLW